MWRAIVIHNDRRLSGLPDGDAEHDKLESRLTENPVITVPAMTLEGDANGAPHQDPSAYGARRPRAHSHPIIRGGVGRDLSRGAAAAFVDAVLAVDGGVE